MSNQLLLRRRAMMASGGIEPASDGRIWAYYDVGDTENPTTILTSTNNIADVVIDDVSQGVITGYTFATTGRHLVKIELTDNTTIGMECFSGRTELVEIYLPASVYIYRRYAFNGCSNTVFHIANKNITIYPSGNPIGYQFNNCLLLKDSFNVSSTSANIPNYCFYGTGIEKIVLNNISSISDCAFYYCSSMNYFEADSNLTNINSFAFRRNSNSVPTTYVFRSTTPPTLKNYNFNANMSGCKIYVPYSADHSILDAYKAAQYWSNVAGYIFELDENGEIPI